MDFNVVVFFSELQGITASGYDLSSILNLSAVIIIGSEQAPLCKAVVLFLKVRYNPTLTSFRDFWLT